MSSETRARAPAKVLWPSAAALLIGGWIAVRYLLLAAEVRNAQYVALSALPPLWVYALFCMFLAGTAAFVLRGWLRGDEPSARTWRLLPMASVLVIAVHVFVLPPYQFLPAEQVVVENLSELVQRGVEGPIPEDPAELQQLLELPPPYLKNGVQMEKWSVSVHKDCTGAIEQAPTGVEPGTLLFCLSPRRDTAWITAVGVAGEFTGPAAVLRVGGEPVIAELRQNAEGVPAAWRDFPEGGINAANEEEIPELPVIVPPGGVEPAGP
ncbi:MAG: hypothetical protein ACK4N5_04260 [Myxococcales bacterium]